MTQMESIGKTLSEALVPPQDVEAERSVLAAMMLGQEAVGRAVEQIESQVFYRTAHQKIFEAIVAGQPNHAKSHYMLGMCYAGEDNKPKAKEHFEKFLSLAPDDPDAGTAKELLKYVSQ